MKKMNVRITFIEELLGTASSDPNIHEAFIASKAPDALSISEEVAAVGADEVVEKQMTVFSRDKDGTPILWDYQIKGFFKDSCGALRKVSGSESKKLTAYKKVVDGLIFPEPRMIKINFDGDVGNCQRPLRASTAQGERVALANSETIPAGATIEFAVVLLDDGCEAVVREWLDYGKFKGIGQWRNSGKGRFTWEEV